MKVGDLVRVSTRDDDNRHVYYDRIGVVVNTWTNHKNKLQGVDVLLENGNIKNVRPSALGLIQ